MFAAVDLGSNSFRMHIGKHEGDSIRVIKSARDPIRLAAGLDKNGKLTPQAIAGAVESLARFRTILRDYQLDAVRVVATNTLRVAKNAHEFLPDAERAIGYPVEIISGEEEGRLIYMGVAGALALPDEERLVIDIGGGSTEVIIGRGLEPERLESLKIGCVGMTQRFFAGGKVTAASFEAAETAARVEIEAIASEFGPSHWRDAFASSGTAAALAEILEQNAFSSRGITPVGLARLKKRLIQAGNVRHLHVSALKPERAPVLAGGLAIMSAAVAELRIQRIDPVGGALRLGVLYDLLGRTIDEDVRKLTVERFVDRYRIERAHAARVSALAIALYRRIAPTREPVQAQLLAWASMLHEIGMSVAHLGFHKHGAYILQHADMPGFSAGEQSRLAVLVYACRGGLDKASAALSDPQLRAQLLALRLAVLFHHARTNIALPRIQLSANGRIRVGISERWLAKHPLTAHLLARERRQWKDLGHPWKGG